MFISLADGGWPYSGGTRFRSACGFAIPYSRRPGLGKILFEEIHNPWAATYCGKPCKLLKAAACVRQFGFAYPESRFSRAFATAPRVEERMPRPRSHG